MYENWTLGDQTDMVNTNLSLNCAPFLNCSDLKKTPGANIASPIVMFLTGTIGNAIALFVLHRNSRREQMRTVFYVLVGSLAWTDLAGIVLTSMPVLTMYVNGRWVGGVGMCNYHAFVMIGVGVITPCIVCTMAVERFIGIRHGYFYKKHVNRSRIRLVLLGQWIFVLIFAALPLFGFGQYARQYPGTWCFFNLHPESVLDSAYAYTFAIFILLLILVIIMCNIAVIGTLIGMRHRRKYLNSPSRERQMHRSPRQREIEIQMVILLVGITLLFTTCWAPLMIQIMFNHLVGHGDDHRQDLLVIRLVSINQTFDPWVYILFRKVIFTKFWKYLRRLCIGHLDPMQSEEKKTAAVHHLVKPPLENGRGGAPGGNKANYYKAYQCNNNLRRQRPHYRAEMPPTALACRGLVAESDPGPQTRDFLSESDSNALERTLASPSSGLCDDCSAATVEVRDYEENLAATGNEALVALPLPAALVALPAVLVPLPATLVAPPLANGGQRICEGKSKSWTNYLNAFPGVHLRLKGDKTDARTNSEQSQESGPHLIRGSTRSALI